LPQFLRIGRKIAEGFMFNKRQKDFEKLLKAANAGDAAAQFELG
jgi:hypothetical protein